MPFPMLSDRCGINSEKLTYIDKSRGMLIPAVFITDRFGALRYQKIAEEAADLPGAAEILNELLLIELNARNARIYEAD
ncbi:MAG: hypothetical protein QW176_00075 [Candidatus Bathyarchaeia archaeon]